MNRTETLKLSPPQILVQAVGAKTTTLIAGRGTGKTTGVAPEWYIHRVKLMPGGASAIVARQMVQLYTRTLPPFLGFLKQMGYVEGIHFVVGTAPPSMWEAKPLVKPEEWKTVIAWCNGHTTYLVHQMRASVPNSLSIQFWMGDEAKDLNKDRLDTDLMPAVRGHADLWGDLGANLPEYGSSLLMTDQPTRASSKWILENEKLHDEGKVDVLINLFCDIQSHRQQLQQPRNKTHEETLRKSMNNLIQMYDDIRRDTHFFLEADPRHNFDILGKDYFINMKRSLPEPIFLISVMNKRASNKVGSFYAGLDEVRHCYDAQFNEHYLRTLDLVNGDKPDWRQDADLNRNLPLQLGPDHGASFNGVAIGQYDGKCLRYVNAMYVLHPETAETLAQNFHEYYQGFPSNHIIYYYDHTLNAASGRALNVTFVQEVCDTLRDLGWQVTESYLGHTPEPMDRFNLWSRVFRFDRELPQVLFNKHKCDFMLLAMETTETKESTTKNNSFKKDKGPERDKTLSQEKAPHITDGADLLLWGVAHPDSIIPSEREPMPPLVSGR